MKKALSILILTLFTISAFAAEDAVTIGSTPMKSANKVYSSSEDFLKAEGNICAAATDGCNSISIVDGKLGAMTEMYCEDVYGTNGVEKWSCTKRIEYKTSEEFLKAEGDICVSATDGCNTVSIVDGELGAMTMMYCENIYGEKGEEKWSCKTYKSDLADNNDDMKVCTMEYNPQCGVDGKTYGNPCMAGDVEIAYAGECKTDNGDMKVCTMEYNPQCGVDGKTYSNPCMAGDAEVLYQGECDNLVDVKQYAKLKVAEDEIQKKLKNIKTETLSKAVEKIDELVEVVKLSRIAVSAQKHKITQYIFLKNVILKELTTRN